MHQTGPRSLHHLLGDVSACSDVGRDGLTARAPEVGSATDNLLCDVVGAVIAKSPGTVTQTLCRQGMSNTARFSTKRSDEVRLTSADRSCTDLGVKCAATTIESRAPTSCADQCGHMKQQTHRGEAPRGRKRDQREIRAGTKTSGDRDRHRCGEGSRDLNDGEPEAGLVSVHSRIG